MKERLDKLLVDRNITSSRQKARAYIMEGLVLVNGERVDKAGEMVKSDSKISLKRTEKFVSRGGGKLEKAIIKQNLKIEGKTCLDIGCSTGGFTDCVLQHGAKKVYAVDVGYGQLNYRLRQDDRVVVLERTNARNLDDNIIKDKIDFLTVDVSFISLKLIIPVAIKFLTDDAAAVVLIKPQFEAGRQRVGKNGVVRDEKTHMDVITSIYNFLLDINLYPINIDFSPIKGPKGNIEFLMTFKLDANGIIKEEDIIKTVKKAHIELN